MKSQASRRRVAALGRGRARALAAFLWLVTGLEPASAFTLMPPADDRAGFASNSPLVVRIDTASEAAAPVIFVIDGLEVSEFARRDGERWILEFPAELAYGQHQLVVYWQDQGQPREQIFLVPIVPDEGPRVNAVARVDGQISHRVADNGFPFPMELDRAEGSGAIQLATDFSHGPVSFTAAAPLLYDSAGRDGALGRRWDLADFLGVLSVGAVTASAGQHAAAPPSLLFQGFSRRGLSLRVDGPQRTFLSSFMFRAEPVTGFREHFGIREEDQRLRGMSIGSDGVTLPGELGQLAFSATIQRGAGGEGGAATASIASKPPTEHGEAYDLAFDLQLFEGRARVGGEWARTRFDFDGGGGADPERDGAWFYYATITPLRGSSLFGQPLDTEFHFEERFTGFFFRSLGNPGAPTDLHSRISSASLSWAGITLVAANVRLRDNQDGNEEQLTFRDDTWSFDLTATPLGDGQERWRAWLGTPTLQAGWSRQRTKPVANVVEELVVFDPVSMMNFIYILPDPYNQTTRTAYAALGSRYQRMGWSASHTLIRSDDATGQTQDVITKSTGAQLDFQPHERIGVNVNFQRDVTRFRDPAFKTTSKLIGGGVQASVIPGKLDGSLRADWTSTQDSARTTDQRVWFITGSASWHVVAPEGMRPGLTLTALGTYQDGINEVTRSLSIDAYQAFLRAEIRWSASMSRGGP